MKKLRRSYHKRVTLQSRVLRYMRISRSMSLRAAATSLGLSNSAICQYEQGRMDVSSERVLELVRLYGYSDAEFREFMAGKQIPILSIKDECVQLLDRIDEAKLRTVHAVLLGFTN
jgi:transcriptional regulator with XRE-family HTH domain